MDGLAPSRSGTVTAREAGLIACRSCGTLARAPASRCRLCGAHIASREFQSLQRVWAWLIAGLILYVPANVYPMLLTRTLGTETESTIIGGAVELMAHGSYAVAAIVFLASIAIPVGKFIAIALLATGLRAGTRISARHRMKLYEVVEFIGRWSMIDVFVVAILTALVQLGFIASINPGPAAVCFGLSVVFTMLSAQSFDPRLIWDAARKDETNRE